MTATSTYHSQLTHEQIRDAIKRYNRHESGAKKRGIAWEFTFDTWIQLWLDSGRWHERGTKRGQYVMCRTGDTGPYSPANVRIDTPASNIREAITPEWRAKQYAGIQAAKKNPNWRANNIAAIHAAKRQPYHTPQGDFESVSAAIKASGVSAPTFRKRAKADPANYYYL